MDTFINSQSQSTFFQIPLEIRISIYRYSLNVENPAPCTPEDAGTRFEQRIHAARLSLQYPTSFQSPDSSLLLTCRRINSEVRSSQGPHRPGLAPTYKLDIITTHETAIPTWLAPPTTTSKTACNLDITLRLFEVLGTRPVNDRDRYWIFAPLFAVLSGLVRQGPHFLPRKDSRPPSSPLEPCLQPMRFKAITIYVTRPSYGDGPCELYGRSTPRTLDSVANLMRPLAGSQLLCGKVEDLRVCSIELDKSISVKVNQNI